MEFSRQEYWSGLHAFLEGLSIPGIEPESSALQADFLPSEAPGTPLLLLSKRISNVQDKSFTGY